MSASNAQKSSEIDNLSKELNSSLKAKESVDEKTQELKDNLDWLRKERQGYSEQVDSLSTQSKALKKDVLRLEEERKSLKASNLEFQRKIRTLTSKVNALQNNG